jgi:hypothetical protein
VAVTVEAMVEQWQTGKTEETSEKILLECHSVRYESQMMLMRIEHADPQQGYTRHNTSIYTEYLELYLKSVIKLYTHILESSVALI